ncbi:hypothetical protein R6Q59_008616 [Mikania micrantha]
MATVKTTMAANDDRPVNALDPVPTTTTEGVAGETLQALSAGKKDGHSGETKSIIKDPVTVTADKNNEEGALVTDTQRKIRRAERFGMPVKLSEQEKRNSRAERFGTTPGPQGSDVTKKAEELKRKARAERFGITQSMPMEEEKKKARLSRFGSASSANPIEEEKRKARALRFSGTPVAGSGKIEPKATIAGKAGGGA